MKAKEFENQLLAALDRLTEQDVEMARQEIGVNTDYEIDQFGFTHVIFKNKGFIETENMYKESFPEISLKHKSNFVSSAKVNYQFAA